MPVVRIKKSRISDLLGGVGGSELKEVLFNLKSEVEEDEVYYHIEVNPDRPDMFIGEGIARAVKGYLGEELGYRKPPIIESGVTLTVRDVPVRPYIAAAVVYNVNVDEDYLEELIQFQEKLHESLGRRRKKVAIGLHDFDKVRRLSSGRDVEVEYAFLPLESVSFTPLGGAAEVKASEVLTNTKQGAEYGSISLRGGMHPFLLVGGKVISMPPVINSEYTAIEPGTMSIFVDVTGTDPELVSKVLDIIVSNIAERPGAVVGSVTLSEAGAVAGGARFPRLETRSLELADQEVARVLGVQLDVGEIEEALLRARHQVEVVDSHTVQVEVPPFRIDVIGTVDLIEDVAMMKGIASFTPRYEPPPGLKGEVAWEVKVARRLRLLALGFGFTEALQLTLTSPQAVEAAGLSDVAVRIENPVQEDYSVLRPSLAVTLIQVLASNQHVEKPVRIFEVGSVVYKAGDAIAEELRLGLAVMDEAVSFEDVQAPLYAILRLLGVDFRVEPLESPLFIPGRAAKLVNSKVGEVAWLGDVSPRVLVGIGLRFPVALAEVSITRIASLLKR